MSPSLVFVLVVVATALLMDSLHPASTAAGNIISHPHVRDQSSGAQHKQQLAPPHGPGAAHEAAVSAAELDFLDASSDEMDSDSDLDSDELRAGAVLKRARKFMGKRARKFMGKRARKFMGKRARKFMG